MGEHQGNHFGVEDGIMPGHDEVHTRGYDPSITIGDDRPEWASCFPLDIFPRQGNRKSHSPFIRVRNRESCHK
jgi:hypothetical protein